MKKQTNTLIFYSFLAVTAFLCIIFFIQKTKLQKQLALAEENAHSQQGADANHFLQRLIFIDSLFFDENYREARSGYEELLLETQKDHRFSAAIRLRISNIRKLINMRERLRSLEGEERDPELSAKSQQIDSLSEQLAITERVKSDQLDSLSFALEKATLRTKSLSKQLANKSRNGYLKFTNTEGVEVHYVGEINGAKASGKGVGLYNTGIRYEGDWKSNLRHGEGMLYWPDGEYYLGSFQLDERSGHGDYFWPNGEKFSGEWENDKRNGPGTFFGKDGKTVATGTWQNNKLVDRVE